MLRVLTWGSGCILLFLAFTAGLQAGQKSQEELRVFASIGLTESLTEIAARYQQETGRKVRLNFAGSDQVAKQVEMDVPSDLFFCADDKWINYLEEKKLIRPETRLKWLASSLVIIVNKQSPLVIKKAEDLLQPKVGRIAIGNPDNVASGIHAREYLTSHGIWQQVTDRLVITANARVSLVAVETDRVGAGFAYQTDVLIGHNARIAYEIPTTEMPPIYFYGAVTTRSINPERAKAFLDRLREPESLAVFKRYGFTILPTATISKP